MVSYADPKGLEMQALANLVTTNETYMFREYDQLRTSFEIGIPLTGPNPHRQRRNRGSQRGLVAEARGRGAERARNKIPCWRHEAPYVGAGAYAPVASNGTDQGTSQEPASRMGEAGNSCFVDHILRVFQLPRRNMARPINEIKSSAMGIEAKTPRTSICAGKARNQASGASQNQKPMTLTIVG
jgi:hypothetical protein